MQRRLHMYHVCMCYFFAARGAASSLALWVRPPALRGGGFPGTHTAVCIVKGPQDQTHQVAGRTLVDGADATNCL